MSQCMAPLKRWPLAILLGFLIPARGVFGEVRTVPEPLYGRLDPVGVDKAYHALREALETRGSHEAFHWRDAASGSFGMVLPLRTFRIVGGSYRRQFHEIVVTRTNKDSGTRTVCRDGAGTWLEVRELDRETVMA